MARRVDVARLLDALGIVARKRGDEWFAPCPVHDDKDPSWHISEEGAWYCFGCTRGGGPADLVAAVHGIGLKDALAWIEERNLAEGSAGVATGVRVVVLPGLVRRRPCVMPAGVQQTPWEQWPTPVRRYVESRGITCEQVERWRVGYALQGPLAARVVFPVEDANGELRSWMARAFDDSDLRYLTPATGADRGAVFGQRHWPKADQRKDATVFVAEGAINALAIERAGADYIAALGGSNTKFESKRARAALEQIGRIATFGRVVVVSDPDSAGDRVARALSVLSRHLEISRAILPKGKDAADIARESITDLNRILCHAEPLQSDRYSGPTESRA